jgi:hypothetical protein
MTLPRTDGVRLHGFALSILHVPNPPLGLLAKRDPEIHCRNCAEVVCGIGPALLNDFPRAMLTLGFGHGTGSAYRADLHAAMNPLFLTSDIFPKPNNEHGTVAFYRTTLS